MNLKLSRCSRPEQRSIFELMSQVLSFEDALVDIPLYIRLTVAALVDRPHDFGR
jgi:hypothetical protein